MPPARYLGALYNLQYQNGKVHGKTVARHASVEFVAFPAKIASGRPTELEIHIILDDLLANETKLVPNFLAEDPHLHLLFAPNTANGPDK